MPVARAAASDDVWFMGSWMHVACGPGRGTGSPFLQLRSSFPSTYSCLPAGLLLAEISKDDD